MARRNDIERDTPTMESKQRIANVAGRGTSGVAAFIPQNPVINLTQITSPSGVPKLLPPEPVADNIGAKPKVLGAIITLIFIVIVFVTIKAARHGQGN